MTATNLTVSLPPSVRMCIVIPCYNHGATVGATLDRLKGFGFHYVLVDDGSTMQTRKELERLAQQMPQQMTLVQLPHNLGKGGAVSAGLTKALELGYTHAAQIDADGQHDIDDFPTMLVKCAQNPGAVITGEPQFDESAPLGRYIGRYITNVWVWIETLSLDIADPQCGYRIYPLEPIVGILQRHHLDARMSFDIEILVRAHWLGLSIVGVPTAVIYPEGGLSHFRMLEDNVRISWTHTRLVFGMLLRLPVILWRKLQQRRLA